MKDFSRKNTQSSNAGAAAGGSSGASKNGNELTQEERDRRIRRAAKLTVERYGHIIERLSKE